MIALVPVSRFRVRYETAAGRPFSEFETLVLRAVGEGATNLTELEAIFHVHPRLVIEALVTLTQAGWLAVGGASDAGFVLTSEGRAAAEGKSSPTILIIGRRTASVIMERLAGALIAQRDARFVGRGELDSVWEMSLALPPRIHDNRVDEGQVQHLLPRSKGERIRWVGPIDMVSKGAHWLPVNVNLDTGVLVGLPDAWEVTLAPLILKAAKAVELDGDARGQSWPLVRQRAVPVGEEETESFAEEVPTWGDHVTDADVMLDAAEHDDYLSRTIQTAASGTSILIATDEVCGRSLDRLEPDLTLALERGARIDVLWSRSDGTAVDRLERLAYKCKNGEFRGAIRLNRSAAPTAERVVVAVSGEQIEAAIGSFDWLGSPVEGAVDLSVRLRAAGLIAALLRCVVARWAAADSEVLAGGPDSWRRLASDLELGKGSDGATIKNCDVSLVVGAGQMAAASELLRDASRVVVITLPSNMEDHWPDEAFQLCNPEIVMVFGAAKPEVLPSDVFKRISYLRASVVVADDRVLVAGTPPFAAPGKHVTGAAVVIEGREPAARIAALISERASRP